MQAAAFCTSGCVASSRSPSCCVVYHREQTACQWQRRTPARYQLWEHFIQSDGPDKGGPNTNPHGRIRTLPFGSFISWSMASSSRMRHTRQTVWYWRSTCRKQKVKSSHQEKHAVTTTYSTAYSSNGNIAVYKPNLICSTEVGEMSYLNAKVYCSLCKGITE